MNRKLNIQSLKTFRKISLRLVNLSILRLLNLFFITLYKSLSAHVHDYFSCICPLLARGGTMELEHLQERYMSCLRSFVEHSAPQQPNRFHDLLVRLPEVSQP